jgi:phosphonate degradation associated HDIG domain protein
MDIYGRIATLLSEHGDSAYVGEPVSQKEHALQSAHLAEKEQVSDTLIVAALLHDIGHLLVADEDAGEAKAAAGIDTRHEVLGEEWLAKYFPPAVTEPVLLHVAAKRYLCATDRNYFATLSPASVRSLELQGGPMSTEEVADFEKNPFFADAVKLRHYDDTAKVPELVVPDIQHYEERIRCALLPEWREGAGEEGALS